MILMVALFVLLLCGQLILSILSIKINSKKVIVNTKSKIATGNPYPQQKKKKKLNDNNINKNNNNNNNNIVVKSIVDKSYIVDSVDQEDRYLVEVVEISDKGEGIVFFPTDSSMIDSDDDNRENNNDNDYDDATARSALGMKRNMLRVLIPNLIPGDKAYIRIDNLNASLSALSDYPKLNTHKFNKITSKNNNNIINHNAIKVYGSAVKLLESSLDRVLPSCTISHTCGGCQLQHMNYPQQLLFKKRLLVNAFQQLDAQLSSSSSSSSSKSKSQSSLSSLSLSSSSQVPFPLSASSINITNMITDVIPSLSIHNYRNKLQFSIQLLHASSQYELKRRRIRSRGDAPIHHHQSIVNSNNKNIHHNGINGNDYNIDRYNNNILPTDTITSAVTPSMQPSLLPKLSSLSTQPMSMKNTNKLLSTSNSINTIKHHSKDNKDKRKIVIGLFESNSNIVVDTINCDIQHELVNNVLKDIRSFLFHQDGVTIYDEATKTGQLRNIVMRIGVSTREVMVCLVAASADIPFLDRWIDMLTKFPFIKSILLNINANIGDTVLGETTKVLHGDSYITDVVAGIRVQVSLKSFMQSNPLQQSVLYNHILLCTEDSIINQQLYQQKLQQKQLQQQQQVLNRERYLNDHNDSDAYNDSHGHSHDKLPIYHDQQPVTVWDLYCGVGTIGMYLSKSRFIKQVIAIEESESAIQDANLNAKLNNITNIRFLCGKVEDFIFSNLNHSIDNHSNITIATKEIANRASASILKRRTSLSSAPSSSLPTMQSQDIIIINPPRRGCHPDLLTKISQSSVRTLIYISCNPQSLVRDLKTLVSPGRDFSVRRIIPVDMFPHTVHVETIVLLERTVSMIKGV